MTEIDVRFEPDHEAPMLRDGRPMLSWGWHPMHGYGWTLTYMEVGEDGLPGNGADDYFIPGDLADVDRAVSEAQDHLRRWGYG